MAKPAVPATMRTSTAGSSPEDCAAASAQRGFTLVELLVVLAIMAFASLAVAPSLESLLAPRPRLSEPEKLVAALAQQRDQAILQRRNVRGTFAGDERGLQDSEGHTLYALPDDYTVLSEANVANAANEAQPWVFHPDGSGCSLKLTLTHDPDAWELRVNALTGRIRLIRERSP